MDEISEMQDITSEARPGRQKGSEELKLGLDAVQGASEWPQDEDDERFGV